MVVVVVCVCVGGRQTGLEPYGLFCKAVSKACLISAASLEDLPGGRGASCTNTSIR